MKQLIGLIMLLSMFACVPNSNASPNQPFPYHSFARINIYKTLKICLPTKPKQKCVEMTRLVAGSSAFVLTPYRFMTAGHMCKAYVEHVSTLKPKSPVKFRMEILEFDGRKHQHKHLHIIAWIDKGRKDYCIIKTDKRINGAPVPIAKSMPPLGSVVYNVASPRMTYDKNMAMMFVGRYSGVYHGRTAFALAAAPGSSGSMIVNGRRELVGIVVTTRSGIPTTFSSHLKDIKAFIKAHVHQIKPLTPNDASAKH